MQLVTLPLFPPVTFLNTKFQSNNKVTFLNTKFQAYNKGNYKHAYTYHLEKVLFCHTLSSVHPLVYFLYVCLSCKYLYLTLKLLGIYIVKFLFVKFTVKWINVKCTIDEFWCTTCNPNSQQATEHQHIRKFLHPVSAPLPSLLPVRIFTMD